MVGPAAGLAALVLLLVVFLVVVKPARPRLENADSGESPATVTAEVADLKPEPSAGSASAGSLPRGARVTVLEDRGSWFRVRTGNGQQGYLPAETVENDAERETRERRSAKILSFPPVPGVVAEESNILLAPYPSAARAGRLPRGTTIRIHAVDHAYYAYARPEGGIAFVYSADVDLVPPDPRRPEIVAGGDRTLKDLKVTDLPPMTPPGPAPPGDPGDSVEPAVLVSKVDPVYPEAARSAGVEGTVVLDATIAPDGHVANVTVVRGLPLGVSDAALDAVRRWQYRPARTRAGPVASHKSIRIAFELNQ